MDKIETFNQCCSCKRRVWVKVYGDPEKGERRNQGSIPLSYCVLPNGKVINTADAPENCGLFQEGMGPVFKQREVDKISKKLHEWYGTKEYFNFLRKLRKKVE